MPFGDQIYHQTKITSSQCHECKTSFIKMPITCPLTVNAKEHKTHRQSLFSSIESSMNGGSLSITGLGRDIESKAMKKIRLSVLIGTVVMQIFIVILSSSIPV